MGLSDVGWRVVEGGVTLTAGAIGLAGAGLAFAVTALLIWLEVSFIVQSPDHLLGTGIAVLPMGLLLLLPRDARPVGLVLLAIAAALLAGAWWTWPVH